MNHEKQADESVKEAEELENVYKNYIDHIKLKKGAEHELTCVWNSYGFLEQAYGKRKQACQSYKSEIAELENSIVELGKAQAEICLNKCPARKRESELKSELKKKDEENTLLRKDYERFHKMVHDTKTEFINHKNQYQQTLKSIKDKVDNVEFCHMCDNSGSYPEGDTEQPEQVQCEFCWTNPNSLFNLKKQINSMLKEVDNGNI
jgi:chromosome segregation ATPase